MNRDIGLKCPSSHDGQFDPMSVSNPGCHNFDGTILAKSLARESLLRHVWVAFRLISQRRDGLTNQPNNKLNNQPTESPV